MHAVLLCGVLDDPRLDALQRALDRLYPTESYGEVHPPPQGGFEAAVALLIRAHTRLELLLIRRASKETDPWSGHVALPGGRRDPGDDGLLGTARRETREEVGFDPGSGGHLLGRLPLVAPRSTRLPALSVTPFVFAVDPPELRLEEREVAAAVWVPLDALMEPGAAGEILVEIEGGSHSFPALSYGDYVVWGLTLRILQDLMAAVRAA